MGKTIGNPGETGRLLKQHNFRIKKSLGQNFLVEPRIIEAIVGAAELSERDVAIEVGPGLGSMTQYLCRAAGQVLAVELDSQLIPILEENLREMPNFSLLHADAMKVDYDAEVAKIAPPEQGYAPGFVVVANLPYYITTPLIMNFLEGPYNWRRLVLMVQKEVADRMRAKPGTKAYGALSVAVQYRARAAVALKVPPTVFVPRPAVDSAVIVLDRLPQPAVAVADEALFFRVVAAAFGQRRKTLLNSLAGGLRLEKDRIQAALTQAGIDGGRRGETLNLSEFAALVAALSD
jgi:16S rRNA (adenine1518-N6/adenine1519-N6)-dimethyltransferase